jgi:hypothetical protein
VTAAAPVCWSCGEVGAHGSVDECLAAMRVTLDVLRPRCAPVSPPVVRRPPLLRVLVRRLQPGGHRHLCYCSRSVTDALRWIAASGKKQDGRYYLEREGERATIAGETTRVGRVRVSGALALTHGFTAP